MRLLALLAPAKVIAANAGADGDNMWRKPKLLQLMQALLCTELVCLISPLNRDARSCLSSIIDGCGTATKTLSKDLLVIRLWLRDSLPGNFCESVPSGLDGKLRTSPATHSGPQQ